LLKADYHLLADWSAETSFLVRFIPQPSLSGGSVSNLLRVELFILPPPRFFWGGSNSLYVSYEKICEGNDLVVN